LPRESIGIAVGAAAEISLARSSPLVAARKRINVVNVIKIRLSAVPRLISRDDQAARARCGVIDSRRLSSSRASTTRRQATEGQYYFGQRIYPDDTAPGFAIVSYLNELSNVFSLNTACDEN
jgi:hypothetical protein